MKQLEQPGEKISEFKRYGPNESAQAGSFKPGDFILTHEKGWVHGLIRYGQSLRYRGKNRKHNRWSHAALIVTPDGGLIEAVGKGVRRSHLDKYQSIEYHLVNIDAYADERDRQQIVKFAESCLRHHYGYLTLASISLNLLLGGRINFSFERQIICSALVARALERSDVIFKKSPQHIMPADLAHYFGVTPPDKSVPKRGKRKAKF
jgi:hypothetical protein